MLGEAASQVPPGTKNAHPAIAWNGAIRMRNRIVHGYWNIDVETLVTTAVEDLPQMVLDLEHAIESLTSNKPTD